MKDLTLLVGTCDKYSFLWDNFKTLEQRYLGLKDCPRVAFSESMEFGDGYTTSFEGKGKNSEVWSNRLLKALKEVDTEFVFFVLEDYYFTREIPQEDFEQIVQLLTATDFNKFMYVNQLRSYKVADTLWFEKRMKLFGTPFIQHPTSDYLTSVQPAVWRTSFLKDCVHRDWSPWDLEIKGTKEIAGENNKILLYHSDDIYFNAVRSVGETSAEKRIAVSEGWEEVRDKENLKEIVLPK